MGFLDKIDYSMIVNSFKQVCKRGHREVFFTNVTTETQPTTAIHSPVVIAVCWKLGKKCTQHGGH